LAFDILIEKLFTHGGVWKEVHTAVVLGAELFGDVWQEAKIDVVGDERCEWGETTAKSKQDLEQSIEGMLGIFQTVLALETATVESNVPVGSVVDELRESVTVRQVHNDVDCLPRADAGRRCTVGMLPSRRSRT
jgi:hypothetical protein